MNVLYHRLPFLIELFFNGIFIVFFSFLNNDNMPNFIPRDYLVKLVKFYASFAPIVLSFCALLHFQKLKSIEEFFRRHVFTFIVVVPLFITWGDQEFAYWLSIVHLFSSALSIIDSSAEKKEHKTKSDMGIIYRLNLKPAQLVLVTFSLIILVGSFLLVLPIAAAPNKSISFVDAIFTATSATCVTGLSTLSLADNFSTFGQIIVLILIQIGGLGIMTLSSSLTIILGKSLAMKQQVVMQDLLDISSLSDLIGMIVDIITYTLIIEIWGGIILTVAFYFEGQEFSQAIYFGFFHSISAFCNAGFALFNNSLENFTTNPLIHGTISVLIILGGLGFIVLKELKHAIVEKKSFVNFSVHTKIVLVTNAALIVLGMLVIFFSEFLHSLDTYTLWQKLQVSFFQSVTTRTAGFNTIGLNSFYPHTLYILVLFMFIGASPGSTGGGIKTTTFAILIQSVSATLKGRKRVEFYDRTVPNPVVVRATSIIIISLIVVSMFIFLLMKIEADKSFITIFFEVISAFATVGLSLGITPHLTIFGKLAIVLLMFIGRVGPLTMVLAIGQKTKSTGQVDYPEGRLMIG